MSFLLFLHFLISNFHPGTNSILPYGSSIEAPSRAISSTVVQTGIAAQIKGFVIYCL